MLLLIPHRLKRREVGKVALVLVDDLLLHVLAIHEGQSFLERIIGTKDQVGNRFLEVAHVIKLLCQASLHDFVDFHHVHLWDPLLDRVLESRRPDEVVERVLSCGFSLAKQCKARFVACAFLEQGLASVEAPVRLTPVQHSGVQGLSPQLVIFASRLGLARAESGVLLI